jgi:hypothetical protein
MTGLGGGGTEAIELTNKMAIDIDHVAGNIRAL